MAPARNSESIPAGFETLPVYAEGEVIPGASPKGVLGAHGIRAFRHIATAVRFVVFSAPGPLVSSTIIVGTEPISDAGHPHTLEHIIFLGSKLYPDRGYLDNLACRCISDGTNAWTDNEYTAYTATTAGLEGFLNLLPCYLDHIMRPKINRPAFDSEVYHIREDGKEAGVVFCEMQAREHTEADLAELSLQRLLYKKTPLAFGCGGICKDIRNLTNEDIAQFHRNQYCGANISVCVGGSDISACRLLSSVKPLLDQMASIPGFQPGVPRWQTPVALEPLPPVTRQIVPFPSSDESIGGITIAWRGPGVVNKSMRTAVDVMLRYLASDVWSPLRQAFVEVEDQIASDIEALQETFLDMGSFMLSFEGVSHIEDEEDDDNDDEEDEDDPMEEIDLEEEETRDSYLVSGKLEKKLMKILQDIVTSGELPGGLDAVHVAIKKEKESLVSEFEAGSHNSVPHHLIEELIYGERGSLVIGEEARGLIGQYDAVKQKDEAFWISILKQMFVDAPRIELIMIPDQQLAEKLAEDEQKSVSKRVKRIGKDALEILGRENKERIASLKTTKFKASSFPQIPSTMSITRFPYSVSRHAESRFYLAQSVALETDFVHCAIMFDSKRLTMDQRMLLPLLAELIPTCDVLLDDMTYVQYTDNARAVSEVTISNYESTVSIGLSYGLAEQCVVVHFTAAPESFERAAQLILRTFFQSEITSERVAAVSQSLLANCLGELREGESVLNAAAALVPYCETQNQWAEKLPNSILYNFVAMYPFVSFLSDEFSSAKKPKKRVRQKVIHKMHDALKHVRSLPPSEIMVQISARDPQSAHKFLEAAWEKNAVRWDSLMTNSNNSDSPMSNSKMEGVVPAAAAANFGSEDGNEVQLPISRRLPARLSDLAQGQVLARVIGIGGVESSFLECRKDCNVFVGHSDWGALNVLIEMLSRVEGPLSDAVRVAGLAYGVHIQFSTWTGVMYVSINESSSLAAAWDAVCNCLTEFRAQLEAATKNGDTKSSDGDDDESSASSTLAVELDTAKASMLFTLNKSRASPGSISVGALSRAAIGAPASPAADQELEAEVEKVSLDCLKRVFDAHVKPLYTADQGRVVVAVCGDSVVADIVEKFASCSHPVRFEECSTEDLYPKVVRSFVKSLRK